MEPVVAPVVQLVTSKPSDTLGREFESQYLGFFLTKKIIKNTRSILISVPASPDQGHDRLCRRGVGRVFLAGVRPDSPSRRRIPSCYRPGPGRGVVVELGQRGAH